MLLGAPTAGGKTEAALFPLLSRMLEESWSGLSVLYVCPLRALLNNLEPRVDQLCRLLGRRAALWHGDIGESERRSILRDPPDVLLTTPESLEAMGISTRVDQRQLLGAFAPSSPTRCTHLRATTAVGTCSPSWHGSRRRSRSRCSG